MFPLTNKNVRIRYLIEKEARRGKYSYLDMAKEFDVDDRTVYTWVAESRAMQHLPSSESRRKRLWEWINDGALRAFAKAGV